MKLLLSLMCAFSVSCASIPTNSDIENSVEAPAECVDLIKLDGPIDALSAMLFVVEMGACHGKPVVVEINSPGGSVFAALEMQKAIERHGAPVVCVVDGMAASAAFVTLQSCHIRAMTSRSVLMAHHASLSGVGGQSHELDNAAEILRKLDAAIVRFCAKRMGMSTVEFESHVAGGKEWWFSTEDALVHRAVDFEMDVQEALELIRQPSESPPAP